jgi:steroid 5-alpha reductase family enzyme
VAEQPRKRKERGASPTPRERMERGYAKAEERNQEAREALEPLAEGERPLVVTIGAVVAALIAASIVIGYLAGTEVNGEKPRFLQVLAPALLMGIMAWGMWRARYWAVLGFQLILVFLIFSAVYGLALQAATVAQVLATLALLAVAGSFFYFMVKAMARIQMPTRNPD